MRHSIAHNTVHSLSYLHVSVDIACTVLYCTKPSVAIAVCFVRTPLLTKQTESAEKAWYRLELTIKRAMHYNVHAMMLFKH